MSPFSITHVLVTSPVSTEILVYKSILELPRITNIEMGLKVNTLLIKSPTWPTWPRKVGQVVGLVVLTLQVPIHPYHHHLLQYQWQRKIYQYKYLPFALSTAPQVFIKLWKQVLSFLHQVGIWLITYVSGLSSIKPRTSKNDLQVHLHHPVLLLDQRWKNV